MLLLGLAAGCAEHRPDIETPLPTIESDYVAESALPDGHGFYLDGQNSVAGHLASVDQYEGDTLSDIARHFGLGYQQITEANPGLDPWVPGRGAKAVLPLQFILPDAKRSGIVINLASMRLFYFSGGKQNKLLTWPIGIGREGRSTPMGVMTVERKTKNPTWFVPESIRRRHEAQGDHLPPVVPPGPDNPLGAFALYLSKPSYLIHGTNKPFSIGLRASNGCIRLYPEDIAQAFRTIPTKTPVRIVNQPYLLGWLDGMLYLEAHEPFEELDARQEKKQLTEALQILANKQARRLDWAKIETTLKQHRGIATPILSGSPSLEQLLDGATPLSRPPRLLGQPEPIDSTKTGWWVKTTEKEDEYWAQKLAAQLNHLGPRIPARAVSPKIRRYQVWAGPFALEATANKARQTINVDFETPAELVNPAQHQTPPNKARGQSDRKTQRLPRLLLPTGQP